MVSRPNRERRETAEWSGKHRENAERRKEEWQKTNRCRITAWRIALSSELLAVHNEIVWGNEPIRSREVSFENNNEHSNSALINSRLLGKPTSYKAAEKRHH